MARGAAGHRKEKDTACESMPGGGVRIFPRRKVGEESTLAPKKNRSPVCFDMMSISPFFDVPQSDAAKNLGISLTALKQVCRKLGLSRWPYVRPKKSKVNGVFAPALTPAATAVAAVTHFADAGGDSPSEREDDCMSSAGSTASYSSADTTRATSGGVECPQPHTSSVQDGESVHAPSAYEQAALEADLIAVARQALPLSPDPDEGAMVQDSGDDMSWLVPPSLPTADNQSQLTAHDLEKEARWWQQYCENDPARPHDRTMPLDGSVAAPGDDASFFKAALLAMCIGS